MTYQQQIPDRPAQLDSPRVKTVMKYAAKAQVWCYQRTNGRVGGTWRVGAAFKKPVPVLLLDTDVAENAVEDAILAAIGPGTARRRRLPRAAARWGATSSGRASASRRRSRRG